MDGLDAWFAIDAEGGTCLATEAGLEYCPRFGPKDAMVTAPLWSTATKAHPLVAAFGIIPSNRDPSM